MGFWVSYLPDYTARESKKCFKYPYLFRTIMHSGIGVTRYVKV